MNSQNPEERATEQATATAQEPKSAKKPRVAPRARHVAPAKGKSARKASPAKKAHKAQKSAPAARKGSKTAQIIALLENSKGATLADLMKATGWQAHSVRGFVSGTLGKKLRLKVESAKRDDGERVYSIRR